ncbi:hypothetical protein HaLaN_21922 [Haematococcus lacustris]|uniref:Uncharacterized protein n=1 Tax=Haematococcus lacustris TaxID=44745 RepID=A0A6A0A044_HAELA|nr:hypothetical protein HaLaN_21922 [Haematococcus lacustris]
MAHHLQLAAGAGAPPELLISPAEQQGAASQLDTSSTRKRRAGVLLGHVGHVA